MNPLFQQMIIRAVQTRKDEGGDLKKPKEPGHYEKAKAWYKFKKLVKKEFFHLCMLVIGILAAGFGLKSFLLPNEFIDGGVTGISLLVASITGFSLPVLIVVLNIPFILIGYWQIGKVFALKTIGAIIGLAICLATIQYPVLT